jgi:hypothetical protein
MLGERTPNIKPRNSRSIAMTYPNHQTSQAIVPSQFSHSEFMNSLPIPGSTEYRSDRTVGFSLAPVVPSREAPCSATAETRHRVD